MHDAGDVRRQSVTRSVAVRVRGRRKVAFDCNSIYLCLQIESEKLLLAAPKISAIFIRSSVLFAVRRQSKSVIEREEGVHELGRQLASKPRFGRRQRSYYVSYPSMPWQCTTFTMTASLGSVFSEAYT